jgi:hypothetical protein
VNGYDFEPPSAIEASRLDKMGRIIHRDHADGQRPRPRRARLGPLGDRPERHAAGRRGNDVHLPGHCRRAAHDRATYLRASGQDVAFTTTRKACSACVRRALEIRREGRRVVDAAGKVTKTEALDPRA